mgnify:CR=1 FL=1|tara:strand:+ start:749 stop:958 length:210 start_codon:yes stop_codon:yes gene_type:complete
MNDKNDPNRKGNDRSQFTFERSYSRSPEAERQRSHFFKALALAAAAGLALFTENVLVGETLAQIIESVF